LRPVITGSIAYDYLMTFPGRFAEHLIADKLDKISVSFLVDVMEKRRGGCAANISYNLALLGERPLMTGSAGRDFGEYRAFLEAAGVDTSGVAVREDVFTASFFANTDLDGNQICSFYTGAMRFAREISLSPLGVGPGDRVIVSPNDPEAMIRTARECRELGVSFIYDPGQQIARLDGAALKSGAGGAEILILNEYELSLFKQKTGLSDPDLFRLSRIVIVTLAERGAEIRTPEGVVPIPVVKPRRIADPTGVGDAFRAGLMKGLAHGLSLQAAGRMGSLAATWSLEASGPQEQAYTLSEFLDRFAETFPDDSEVKTLRS